MKILLTNDDGIKSEGLRLLALELQKEYDVYVIAPDSEKSATSHGITVRKNMELKKLRLEGIKNDCYSLTGTPADCVRVGLEVIYDDIDIIFSGINRGYNAGTDIQYSGTIGACAEANIYGKPGIAVSTEFKDGSSNFEVASKFAPIIFKRYKDLIMPEVMVFSINIPKLEEIEIKGIKVCEIGGIVYDTFTMEELEEDTWDINILERRPKEIIPDSDHYYLRNGYITITPIKYFFKENDLFEKFSRA